MNFVVILYLILAWLLCAAIGFGIVHALLPRNWHRERAMLMPTVGAGILILGAEAASYLGLPMLRGAPIVGAGGLAASAAAWWVARGRRLPSLSWGPAIGVHVLGLVGATSVVLSVVRYHAWNPYMDSFTYISIADYLQTHAYFTPAVPRIHEPLLTQMWLYQNFNFRLGSPLLLAFFTALFRAEYSFDLYIPVLALGVWIGVPGFWVFCRRALLMGTSMAAVAVALYALDTAIPVNNALWGFLPQTWGMAFVLPTIALYLRAGSRSERRRRWAATGLFFALTLFAYTEIIPFALLVVAASYLSRIWFGRFRLKDAVTIGLVSFGIALVLVPLAAFKFFAVIRLQLGALGGWDPHLGLFDYIGMLAGYRSLAQDALNGVGPIGAGIRLAAVAAAATAWYAAVRAPIRTRRQLLLVSVPFVLALTWFGLYATNPWNAAQVGHPWNIYKLVTYSFFLFIALWGMGLVLLWRRGGTLRAIALVQLVAYVAFFPKASAEIAKRNAESMQQLTGVSGDPTAEYKRLRVVLSGLPADTPVNLLIPSSALKHRQLVAYFVRRPVIASWSDDDYIGAYLEGGGAPMDPKYPVLQWAPGDPERVANLRFRRDEILAVADFGPGWHGEERDGSHSWHWLEQQGEIRLNVTKSGWLVVHGDLAVVGAPQRTVTLRVLDHPELDTRYMLGERWFVPFSSDRIHLSAGQYRFIVGADGPPNIMGPRDPRSVRIGVRDWSWTVTPD